MKIGRSLSLEETFTMKKNDIVQLPPDVKSVIIGLGWSVSTWIDNDIDFDASIVCLDADKEKLEIVNFAQKKVEGIIHRGDDVTGAGSGDDERIRIDFEKLPSVT